MVRTTRTINAGRLGAAEMEFAMCPDEELEYGPDILTLEDEDGAEHEFEVLDTYEEDGSRYIAVIPVEDEASLEDDDGELIVLKVEAEGEEEFLAAIEEEEEFNKISTIFMERLEEYYDFTE